MNRSEPVPQDEGAGPRLTRLIRQSRSPNRRDRDDAFAELHRHVAGPMRELLAGCAGRPGPPVVVTEAVNDAVATLFVRWNDLRVEDTAHFRALVVQAVYWKVVAQRRAARRLFEAVSADAAGDAPARPEIDFRALDAFEEAVEALAEWELARGPDTPLADAVKARHLVGHTADPPAGHAPTFDAVGQLLGVGAGAARGRYWAALEWLHERFPNVVPALPARKKSGRPAGEENARERDH